MQKKIELVELPYEKDALGEVITKETLDFHHGKHLATYVANLNAALENETALKDKCLVEILKDLKSITSSNAVAIRNNGGGVYNHNFYFEALCSPANSKLTSKIESLLVKNFGSVENFYSEFKNAGLTQFGSGWAWLVQKDDGSLEILKTANQDTPLELGFNPLLTVDVWEHAYYLDYQNRRVDYLDKFFNIINWEVVESRLLCETPCCSH